MAIKGDFWAFASWALGSVEGALFERFWGQVAIVELLQAYQRDVDDFGLTVDDVMCNLGLQPYQLFPPCN